MSRGEVPYYCNGCGKTRDSDVNRWWVLREIVEFLNMQPWSENAAARIGAQHACGERCALKIIQNWMARIQHVGQEANEIKEDKT